MTEQSLVKAYEAAAVAYQKADIAFEIATGAWRAAVMAYDIATGSNDSEQFEAPPS